MGYYALMSPERATVQKLLFGKRLRYFRPFGAWVFLLRRSPPGLSPWALDSRPFRGFKGIPRRALKRSNDPASRGLKTIHELREVGHARRNLGMSPCSVE